MARGRVSLGLLAAFGLVLAACTSDGSPSTTGAPATTQPAPTTTQPVPTTTAPAPTTTVPAHDHGTAEADAADVTAAALANAAFQDLAAAEAAGYGSTLDGLGCFHSAESGGMGVHYLREELMDDQVDITTPEALVYEMGPDGEILQLVAHEYIVPVEAWTGSEAPNLFGVDFHQHSVLPLWVLHAWIWKDNPSGFFVDYNPTVRMCPEGVPVFGVDLP